MTCPAYTRSWTWLRLTVTSSSPDVEFTFMKGIQYLLYETGTKQDVYWYHNCNMVNDCSPITVTVDIIFISPPGEAWKKMAVLGKYNSHCFGTILSSLPAFCSCGWSNSLNHPAYIFSSSISLQQPLEPFSHCEDKGSIFLQTVRTFNHHTVQWPKVRP